MDDEVGLAKALRHAAPQAAPWARRAVLRAYVAVQRREHAGVLAFLAALAECVTEIHLPPVLEPRVTRTCDCGSSFRPYRAWHRYCSVRCRVRAFRSL